MLDRAPLLFSLGGIRDLRDVLRLKSIPVPIDSRALFFRGVEMPFWAAGSAPRATISMDGKGIPARNLDQPANGGDLV